VLLKRNVKVLLTNIDLATEEDLERLSPQQVWRVSALENLSQTTQSDLRIYQDSSNSIDLEPDRGIVSSPGPHTTYSITLDTGFTITPEVTNNAILWESLLVGVGSLGSTVVNKIISAPNSQKLQTFSLIVVSGSFATVYRRCIVNQATLNLGLTNLATISWNIISTGCFGSADIREEGDKIFYQQGEIQYQTDLDHQYIANKTMLTSVDGYSVGLVNLAATGLSLVISNNATVIPNEGIDKVGQLADYKLGSFTCAGQLSVYYKSGDCARFLGQIKAEYEQISTAVNRTLTITLKSSTRTLQVRLLGCSISTPDIAYDTVFTVNLPFILNNYKNSAGFELAKV
jgi:hypothetical protein